MSNEKLSSIAILATERERAQSLDSDKVIDAFGESVALLVAHRTNNRKVVDSSLLK